MSWKISAIGLLNDIYEYILINQNKKIKVVLESIYLYGLTRMNVNQMIQISKSNGILDGS